MKKTIYLGFLLIVLASCKTQEPVLQKPIPQLTELPKIEIVQPEPVSIPPFKLGIEVLQQSQFEFLKGKRVGLVTNPTGVDSKLRSTVDILFENENVNLVALFGPEHGVRGNFSAGDQVGNNTDEKTGLPVYSLYGNNKKPNAEAMNSIDVIVYDIQDIGVRSYTYISTMGLVMEAAADFDKEVIILDRPNPLGGNRIEGPRVKEGFYSFVSQFDIPYVYGLTCGELALLLNNEGLLNGGRKCNLQVVKMEGWYRNMVFKETGLTWVPTSPHIPTWESAFYYATTGIIGEIDPNMIGIGYPLPFQTLVTPNIDAHKVASTMNALHLNGVIFRPIFYKPYYMDRKGEELQGVQIHITDFKSVNLTEIQFYYLQVAKQLDPKFDFFKGKEKRFQMFDYGCGSDLIRKGLMTNYNFESLKPLWNADLEAFRNVSKTYYLYE